MSMTPSINESRRFLIESLDVRGTVVRLTDEWIALTHGRDYPSAVREVLGQLITTLLLIASSLKVPGRLSFQLKGDGPVNLLLADATEELFFRGVAHHNPVVQPASVSRMLGHGKLVMTLENAASAKPYQSIVPLSGNTLAEIFDSYLTQSEQTDTHLILAAGERQVSGLLLQKLPGADALDPDGWNRTCQLSRTLTDYELHNQPLDTLLPRLFPEEDVRVFDPQPLAYHCPREDEKIMTMLRSLGRNECESILTDQGVIEVRDEICNETYTFGEEEVAALFDGVAPAPPTLH